MSSETAKRLDSRMREFGEFRRAGAYHSALQRIAEIENIVNQPRFKDQEWATSMAEDIDRLRYSRAEVRAASNGLLRDCRRILRISSIGDLCFDEALLIVTLRVESELISKLTNFPSEGRHTQALAKVDSAVEELATSKKDGVQIARAKLAAEENWGLPIDIGWFKARI